MRHIYVRLSLILLLIFTAVLLLIHVQPYDDHELRAILVHDGCLAPCFMGIHPGVTQHEAVIKLLNKNNWVNKITFEDSIYIKWTWSGKQPDWINSTTEGLLSLANDRVITIQFKTGFRFGNLLLSMGDNNLIHKTNLQPHRSVLYDVRYPNYLLNFSFTLDCPYHVPYLQPLNVIIGLKYNTGDFDKNHSYDRSFFRCSS